MAAAQSSSRIIVEALWKQAHSTVHLPQSLEIHQPHGASPAKIHATLRSFDWHHWHTRCILLHNENLFGVVSRDLSRSGVGFYSPIEIAPGQSAEIVMPGLRVLKIKSLHSSQLGEACFECGACFKGNTGSTPAHA